jgi:hypothetical protein
MVRLVLRRTCGQVGFEQSEYEYKTVDVNLPNIEALMERPGLEFCIIGAHLVAAQKAEESGGTSANTASTQAQSGQRA